MKEWLKKIDGPDMAENVAQGNMLARDSFSATPTRNRLGKLLSCLIVVLLAASVVACITLPTRAKFDAYSLKGVSAIDASQVLCRYGRMEIANYSTTLSKTLIPRDRAWGASGATFWTSQGAHPVLTCRWLAADGTPRQEVVPMEKLLLPPYITWDKLDGRVVSDVPPIQGSPVVLVEINDRTIRVVLIARLRLEGEFISPNSQRIRIQEVTKVLYERHGTEGAMP